MPGSLMIHDRAASPRQIGLSILVILSFIFFSSPASLGCTLWAASGSRVVGGGILIAKNRDSFPDHQQQLHLSQSSSKDRRYVGLMVMQNNHLRLKAGINQHGLVVVTASPPAYLDTDPAISKYPGNPLRILTRCQNVTEALSHREWLKGPRFLMLADPQEVAIIEIGLDGMFRVQSTKSGVLSHTNHYLDPDLVRLNREEHNLSSAKRLDQIKMFMESREKFTLDDFVRMSGSTEAGPDHSLWRTGSKPNSSRTLATWIVHQPPKGGTTLYLKMANPGKPIREHRFHLQDVFAGKMPLSEFE